MGEFNLEIFINEIIEQLKCMISQLKDILREEKKEEFPNEKYIKLLEYYIKRFEDIIKQFREGMDGGYFKAFCALKEMMIEVQVAIVGKEINNHETSKIVS